MVENRISAEDEEVVSVGHEFLSALARRYGPEKAITVWNAMGEALGLELKNEIFLLMLTGDGSLSVRISLPENYQGNGSQFQNVISVIKIIRTHIGYGLKEAKDVVDAMRNGSTVTLRCKDTKVAREFRAELRSVGVIVT